MPKYKVNFHATHRVVTRSSMEVLANSPEEAMKLAHEHMIFSPDRHSLEFTPTGEEYTAIHALSTGLDFYGIHLLPEALNCSPTHKPKETPMNDSSPI